MGRNEKADKVQSAMRNPPWVTQYHAPAEKHDEWRNFVIKISADKIRALGFFAVCVALSLRIVIVPSFADTGMLLISSTQHLFLFGLAYSVLFEFRWAILRHIAKRKG